MINSSSVGKSFNLTQTLQGVVSNTNVNQIRGINTDGSTGSGIPKQVTNVGVSVSNASQGATSSVTVTFGRDPSDVAFGGVNILVKGYQANPSQVQLASGADSPVTFVLNNTGESLSIAVQAFGNGGSAPISTAPTAGVKLPKSTAGGFGTTTSTSGSPVSGSASPGQLAKFATPATTVTGGDLSGDVTTAGSVATTLAAIRGVAVASSVATPAPFDGFQYNNAATDWEAASQLRLVGMLFSTGLTNVGQSYGYVFLTNGPVLQTTTATGADATMTTPPLTNMKPNSAGTGVSGGWNCSNEDANPTFGNVRRIKFALRLSQTTNMRIWIGLGSSSGVATNVYRADIPASNFVGFRYSPTTASDTKYQCVTQVRTSTTAQTINAETTSSHVDATTLHVFEIQNDGTNAVFLIDNVKVGAQSSNIPTAILTPLVFIDSAGVSGQPAFDFAYSIIESRQ